MLLVSPSEAAAAIGAKCGGSAPSNDDPALVSILRMITPRVEEACNVFSLTLGASTERFDMVDMPPRNTHHRAVRRKASLRLTNGFLIPDDSPDYVLTVLDPAGDEVDLTDTDLVDIDRYYGVIHLFDWERGAYTVEYQSGFAAPEPSDPPVDGEDAEDGVLLAIPDWMKSIAIGFLVTWYRTMYKNPSAPEKISYGSLMSAMRKEIYPRVYGKYQRPRTGCVWGDRR